VGDDVGRTYRLGTFVEVQDSKSQPDAALARKIAASLGKEIVFFTARKEGDFFNGAVLSSDPKRIFVNANHDRPLMVVVGHEIGESLKRDLPDVYKKLKAIATQEMVGLDRYQARLNWMVKEQGGKQHTLASAGDELLNDFIGDSMTERTFWSRLARAVPEAFIEIARTVRRVIDKILGKNSYTPESYRHFKDIRRVRKAVEEALAEYRGKGGSKQSADVGGFAGEIRAFYSRRPAPAHDADTIAWEPKKKTVRQWWDKLKADAYQQFVDEASPAIRAAEKVSPELGQVMREEFSSKRGSAGASRKVSSRQWVGGFLSPGRLPAEGDGAAGFLRQGGERP